MTEVIKEIKGFEGRYTISNLGIVRSLLTHKIMKLSVNKFGYQRVNLRYANSRKFKSYLVHTLVASNFLENPNKFKEINHKDCNKLNNVASNLEWCSRQSNMHHASEHHLINRKGELNSNHKITQDKIKEMREFYKQHSTISFSNLGKLFGLKREAARNIIRNISWSDN